MASTREIQSRISSIQDTRKITSAMYMISSTKLRKAKRELEETEPYFYTLQSVIARIMRHMPEMEHPYFGDGRKRTMAASDGQADIRKALLVVTADKGLAGAYNHNALKLAEEEMEQNARVRLFVVGEVGRQYFAGRKIPVDEHFLYTAQNPTMSRARTIAARLLELYDNEEIDEVYMIYTSMKNSMQTEARMERLLPLSRGEFAFPGLPVDVPHEQFKFRPSPEAVMDSVVPNYLAGFIYGGLVESYCSEHNARMMAMQAANDNAGEMLRQLSVEFNRMRQAMITQEITEVIAGAKAQKRKKKQKQQTGRRLCV